MGAFFRFVGDYFDDQNRYLGTVLLVVALLFGYGWANSVGMSSHVEPVHLIYGVVTVPLTLFSGYLLVVKPRLKPVKTQSLATHSPADETTAPLKSAG